VSSAFGDLLAQWASALRGAISTVEDNLWWTPIDEAAWPTDVDVPKGIARRKQRPPPGAWFVWLILSGRGFGKTRTGTEWLDAEARKARSGEQVLLAGRTPSDVQKYALEGPGGLLTNHPDVIYKNRTLYWPNGVVGIVRSGANPEEFRGFSGSKALLDEFAAWDYPVECWNNLIFGMREGDEPRITITTTPKPLAILKQIMAMPGCVVVRGSTYENRRNLAEAFIKNVVDPLVGTRLGRQEIDAELLSDVPGALWTLQLIDDNRLRPVNGRYELPALKRIVVGVDPQGTKSEDDEDTVTTLPDGTELRVGAHETGIAAAAVGVDGEYYVLMDVSINGTPNEWGEKAVDTYDKCVADVIVGETNFGGQMVEFVVRAVRDTVPFKMVTASRGKRQRAEPISTLYERKKVHHVGSFPSLEDQMTSFVPGVKASPNRMDALVWAMVELSQGEAELEAGTW